MVVRSHLDKSPSKWGSRILELSLRRIRPFIVLRMSGGSLVDFAITYCTALL